MPRVINGDVIEKIAEYAERNYSKSATARELDLDRTTVRKYWPRKKEGKEEKEGEEGKHKLSIEEEFQVLNKKQEIDYELERLLNKIKYWKWETERLKARGEAAVVGIDFLKGKLGNAESVAEVDKVRALVNEVANKVTALLDENEPLRKQRREQQVRKEKAFMEVLLDEFAWIFPCRREQAKKIVNRLVSNNVHGDIDRIGALQRVDRLLMIAEDLDWEDNVINLQPLITPCLKLLKGNWAGTERIMGILYERKTRILIPSDQDMERKWGDVLDLLIGEASTHCVAMVLKFNAALGRLADERSVDKDELLSKESATEPAVR